MVGWVAWGALVLSITAAGSTRELTTDCRGWLREVRVILSCRRIMVGWQSGWRVASECIGRGSRRNCRAWRRSNCTSFLCVNGYQVGRRPWRCRMSGRKHRNVHPFLAAGAPCGITFTRCAITASGRICVVSRVDRSHNTGKACLADACKWIPHFLLLLHLPSLAFIVPVSHMSLQVSGTQISPPAPIVSIPTASLGAEENISQPSLFDSGHLIPTPWANSLLLLGATKAEDVFARNHSAVDQDRFQAFVATVDHRVHDLLPNQVHLVVPVKCKHGSRVTPIYRCESRRFYLAYISLHVILGQ